MSWQSQIYSHYNVSLIREYDDGEPVELHFQFTCKEHSNTHSPHFRACMKAGEGTSNLQNGANQCNLKHNVPLASKSVHAIPYSEAAHRALIALRCAKNQRPFNSVLDEDYQAEVNILWPGTKLPHPQTVS